MKQGTINIETSKGQPIATASEHPDHKDDFEKINALKDDPSGKTDSQLQTDNDLHDVNEITVTINKSLIDAPENVKDSVVA